MGHTHYAKVPPLCSNKWPLSIIKHLCATKYYVQENSSQPWGVGSVENFPKSCIHAKEAGFGWKIIFSSRQNPTG